MGPVLEVVLAEIFWIEILKKGKNYFMADKYWDKRDYFNNRKDEGYK